MALARAKECFQQEERQNKAMEVDMAQGKALEDQDESQSAAVSQHLVVKC